MGWWEWVFSGIGVTALKDWIRGNPKPSGASLNAQGAKVQDSPVAGRDLIQTTNNFFPPAQVIREANVEPRPNLVNVGVRETFVFQSPFPIEGVYETRKDEEYATAIPVLVMRFTNQPIPDSTVGQADSVVATISFKSADKVTEQRIDYAVWLNSSGSSASFDVGDTRELIVVAVSPNETLTALEDRRTDNIGYDACQYLRVRAVQGLLDFVEISLTDQPSQTTIRQTFKIRMQGAHFCVSRID
jgi:hypothetical protein